MKEILLWRGKKKSHFLYNFCEEETLCTNLRHLFAFVPGNKPHYLNTSSHFLRHFRKGELGRIFLGGESDGV